MKASLKYEVALPRLNVLLFVGIILPVIIIPELDTCTTLPVPLALNVMLPFATGIFTFDVPLLVPDVPVLLFPEITKLPPSGLVMIIALPLALIVALPSTIVLPARYKLFQRLVALPKLYVTLALGLILPATTMPVPVTVTTPLLPATPIVTLPLTAGIFTLLVPLLIPDVVTLTVVKLKLPAPSVCKY